MMEDASINASNGPTPQVFPPARLGLLRLDTAFPRPPGDLGEPASWPVPVDLAVVPRASPARVVRDAAGLLRDAGLLHDFIAAARTLQARGVAAVTTSCGFLVLWQRELQAELAVPVVTSSLLELPRLLLEEPQVGVLTISAAGLGDDHLRSAGVPEARLRDVLVQGVAPEGEFASAILGNRTSMDLRRAERDVVGAALALQARAPGLRTLVLECTNMPPYAAAVREATGLRVLSLLDAAPLRAALGLRP
ncbi:MAG: aspartate/glutamate racemase family protein [Pseudomonadota bacterium]